METIKEKREILELAIREIAHDFRDIVAQFLTMDGMDSNNMLGSLIADEDTRDKIKDAIFDSIILDVDEDYLIDRIDRIEGIAI